MCGIAGFIDFSRTSHKSILEVMTRTLSHRGPDGEGFFFKENHLAQIGLGHRRLSIIDLSKAASQPMQYKSFQIVFNGEIYNYEEIKKKLSGKGHHFTTNSDTEVILHAFEEWGHHAVSRFIGMFAFVIFDEQTQQIVAFRDRAGVKPFYYYWNNGLFLFGSELKAIVAHPCFIKRLNIDAAVAFMQYGNVPAPYCIYDTCFKLEPGHYATICLEKKELTTTQYWNVYDAYNQPKLKITETEAIEETERIIKKACDYRMVADVPVGVFLSGGYDSSCITALLQKDSTEKIKTFTIGFHESGFDEVPFAREVAKYLGTDHTEYYCTQAEALQIIPELSLFFDEPFADSSAIPTILVSRMARKKVTVALSADAGDELFAGYSKYDSVLYYRNKIKNVPAFVRKSSAPVAAFLAKLKTGDPAFATRYEKLSRVLKNPTVKQLMINSAKLFSDNVIPKLFCKDIKLLPTSHLSEELKSPYADELCYMLAIDYQTYLPDDILQKVDRASMSVGLEAREPLLDQHLVEWVAKLPTEMKYRAGTKKYIFKQIVHRHLPEILMERPKMGFAIPISDWLKKDIKKVAKDYFRPELIKSQGIFDEKYVKNIIDRFYNGQANLSVQLWYVLMFQMWYERWMK
jgi:asparagine synthase (glutamine-hydrolysing)